MELPSPISALVHTGNVERVRAFVHMRHAAEVKELEAVREEAIPRDFLAPRLLASLEVPDPCDLACDARARLVLHSPSPQTKAS